MTSGDSPRPGKAMEVPLSSRLGEGAITREEHVSTVLGLRRAALIGLLAWPFFGLVDWFTMEIIESGRLWVLLVLRGIGLAGIALAALRVNRKPLPSPGLARFLDVATFAGATFLVSAGAIEYQGATSLLSLGVMTILAVRTATLPDKWQRALLPIGLIALLHPLTIVAMAFHVPNVAGQFARAEQVGTFILNQVFVFAGAAITLAGGHTIWSLRRKIYETRSLGRYRLKHRIGKGGMGEVWAAHHNTLSRDVAVKVLRPDKVDEAAHTRFEREVQAMSQLTHPNTVRVFDYGVSEDGLCYYAMELLEGEDLGAILKREGTLPPERAIHLVSQGARALAEAHDHGIVHRDIKLENLYVSSAGVEKDLVKVLDFGLAKFFAMEKVEMHLTTTGYVVGTPMYVAPEVVLGNPADPPSDVYALGAVLYKLLCGAHPFEARDVRAILAARVREDPKPPSEVLGTPLPEALEAVVMRCLARDPADRYKTAGELTVALERCATGTTHSAVRRAQHVRGGPSSSEQQTQAAGEDRQQPQTPGEDRQQPQTPGEDEGYEVDDDPDTILELGPRSVGKDFGS